MEEIRVSLASIENQPIKIKATTSRLGRVVTYEAGKANKTTNVFRSILLKDILILSPLENENIDHLWLDPNDFCNQEQYLELMQYTSKNNCDILLEGIVRKYKKYPSYDNYKHITYYTIDFSVSDIQSYTLLSMKERLPKQKRKKTLNFKGYYVARNGKTYFNNKVIYHYGKKIKYIPKKS